MLDQYLENLQETNRLKGRKYKRSVWIRELFRQPGDFDILVNDLRATDREYHFHYTRMSKECFDHLLTLISPKITKQDKRKFFEATVYTCYVGISSECLGWRNTFILSFIQEIIKLAFNTLTQSFKPFLSINIIFGRHRPFEITNLNRS